MPSLFFLLSVVDYLSFAFLQYPLYYTIDLYKSQVICIMTPVTSGKNFKTQKRPFWKEFQSIFNEKKKNASKYQNVFLMASFMKKPLFLW